MGRMSYVKKSIAAAVCMALCAVLPLVFHSVPNSGKIILPMHFPVLLCGLICGWPFGLLCGIAGPTLSTLIIGMPPVPALPSMMVELASYGLVAGAMMQAVQTRRIYADLYISLFSALIVGRVLAGISRALIFSSGNYSMAVWATSYFITALPGLALQLILLPNIVFALEAANLIPKRYPKASP